MRLNRLLYSLLLCLLALWPDILKAQSLQVAKSSAPKVNRTTSGGMATIFFDSNIEDLSIVCTEEDPNESIVKINDHQWFVNINVNKDIEADGVCYRNYLLKCSASAEYFLTTDEIAPNQVLYYTISLPNELEPQLLKMRGRTVSEKALRQLQEGNYVLATNIMLELLPSKEKHIPYLPEYEEILFSIYDSLKTSHWYPITIKGHLGEFMCSTFSDDGNMLVSGSNDKSARVWDMRTGQEYSNLRMMHSTSVDNVTVSPNKKFVVTRTLYSDSLFLWSIEDNIMNRPRFIGIGESPFFLDNEKVGYKHVKKHEQYDLLIVDGLSIYNIVNETTDSLVGYHSVYISKDMKNKVLLTENKDTVKNKNISYYMEVECPKGHKVFKIPNIHITDAKYSPNNKYFAVRSNNQLDIFDLSSLSVCKTLADHVNDFVFSNDQKYVIYCCLNNESKTVRVWDIKKGKLINKIQFPWQVTSLSFSTNGLLFAGGRNGHGRFWKFANSDIGQNDYKPLWDCGDIRFFENGDVFLIKENIVEKKNEDNKFSAFCNINICNTDIFNNRKIVAVSSYDPSYKSDYSAYGGYITILYNRDGRLVRLLPYRTLALALDHPWIISNEKNIHDYLNKHVVMSFKGHYNNLTCGAFLFNDSIAVTGSYDHTVRFWDVQLGTEIIEKRIILDNSIKNIIISEDNGYIFICDDNDVIYICNFEFGNIIKTIQLTGSLAYMQYDEAKSILKCLVKRSYVYPEWNATYDLFQYKIPSTRRVIEELQNYKYNLSSEERKKYYLE